LPKVIAELTRRPGAEIVVIGHTDRVGLLADNDALSIKRAQTMARIFEQRGVARALLQAVGRGEREPLVATADEVPEPANRRVEVTVR
jgi:outer membrane protein OmpA-like peptidoglycan-associated protein